MPAINGIPEPVGGWKQGAWVQGRQYWGGTLSEPGQINQFSNQKGAGQQVSQEVIAQTNPANVAFIEQQRKQAALAPSPTAGVPGTPSQPSTTGTTSGAGAGITPQPTIDLQSIYNNLYNSPEMKGRQDKVTQAQAVLSQKEKEKIEAVGMINDNPFLSEATRVGRVAKLESLYNERTANLRKDIEMAASEMTTGKADAEMQLNLQLKQFDINSQAARDALSQFNSLLSSGALDGASGDDIANITRGTGISSSMIQSAINANREKNVKTSTISYDDGESQGFAIINDRTGEIINRQTVAATSTKPEKPKGIADQQKNDKAAAPGFAAADAKNRMTLGTMMSLYSGYGMTNKQIYDIYVSSTPYKQDATTRSQDKNRYNI